MMGYRNTTVHRSQLCAWCGKEIPAGWPAKKCEFTEKFFHATCAWARELHFRRLLARHH